MLNTIEMTFKYYSSLSSSGRVCTFFFTNSEKIFAGNFVIPAFKAACTRVIPSCTLNRAPSLTKEIGLYKSQLKAPNRSSFIGSAKRISQTN